MFTESRIIRKWRSSTRNKTQTHRNPSPRIRPQLSRQRRHHLPPQPIPRKQPIHLLILLLRRIHPLPPRALELDVVVFTVCERGKVRAESHTDAASEELGEPAQDYEV